MSGNISRPRWKSARRIVALLLLIPTLYVAAALFVYWRLSCLRVDVTKADMDRFARWFMDTTNTVQLLVKTRNSGSPAASRAVPEPQCKKISVRDAEILLYLMPVADELRAEEMDVGWKREPGVEEYRQGAYAFRLENARRYNPNGSVTIGYFLVDKCTGIIRQDETGEVVTSPMVRGVQRIMTREGEQSPAD
ncbi:MAG TPA: hypothetical protein VFA76_03725 [Terriglobales bacterium]|nr:hypothetical protein [Terriglobales bacterium]